MTSDFMTLTCPNCGGKLQITQDIERFACMYCGTEQLVKRSGGIISLEPVLSRLNKLQATTDKAASELAIVRLQKDIDSLRSSIENARKSVSEKKQKSIKSCLGAFVFYIAVMVCAGAALSEGIKKGQATPYIVLGLFTLIVIIGAAGIAIDLFKSTNADEDRLNLEIQQKESEIQRHRAIIAGS